jgi:C-22 sterol desaturase
MAVNASFVSPTADAKVAHMMTQLDSSSLLAAAFNGFSVWRLLITMVVLAIAYDQCKQQSCLYIAPTSG